jgi:membrane fusion protein (multidrug efflux system)
MSSADPTDVDLSTPASGDTTRGRRAPEKGPAGGSEGEEREDGGVRSEKPQAKPEASPENTRTDGKPAETNEHQEQGIKGIKGAFRKHPVAMIVCLGLIVVGVVAGVAWYLHARHYESTDDAFIDGRSVLVSPQVTGSIVSVNSTTTRS